MSKFTDTFINEALAGKAVYISEVRNRYNALPEEECCIIYCALMTLEKSLSGKTFKLKIPREHSCENLFFCFTYILSELYNMISVMGGKGITIYSDKNDNILSELISEIKFTLGYKKVRAQRSGYGLCLNVAERMCDSVYHGFEGDSLYEFKVVHKDIRELPDEPEQNFKTNDRLLLDKLANIDHRVRGKIICGIDIGGTDIKAVIVHDSEIKCIREYNWDPASYSDIEKVINTITAIISLLRCQLSLEAADVPDDKERYCKARLLPAVEVDADYTFMLKAATEIEGLLGNNLVKIDAIGIAFPDVVVNNKIVGGETTKTQGVRNNTDINYEQEFARLTHLDEVLKKHFDNARVNIINDGFMAAFTAAVEISKSSYADKIRDGVFAYTIGTELGTGWVNKYGDIPEIPLNKNDIIIDLGSLTAANITHEKIESTKNTNTGISGTLQQYVSQSGIFRLALDKYFRNKPDLIDYLLSKGYMKPSKEIDKDYFLHNDAEDMRKKLLEYIISLLDKEHNEEIMDIFREVGRYLGYGETEIDYILTPEASLKILFGRGVKNKEAFDLVNEGAKSVYDKSIYLFIEDIAYSPLMRQLKDIPGFNVSSFGQAVGAVYYAVY